jgi:hypothetical protein
MLPLVWLTGMDTGVVFCRREDFDAVGGYNENLMLAEDVRFLLDLRAVGRRRGQRLVRVRAAKAVASTRKFDKHGDWHYFPMLARGLSALLFRGKSLERFARTYWYGRQRTP